MKNILFCSLSIIVGCAPSFNRQQNDSRLLNSENCHITSLDETPRVELLEFQNEIDDFFSSHYKSDLLYIQVVSGRTDKNILKRIFFDQDSLHSYLIAHEPQKSIVRISDEASYGLLSRQLLSGHYLQTCTRFSSVDNLVIVILKKNGDVSFSANYDNLVDISAADKEKFSTLINLDKFVRKLSVEP